MRRIIEEMAKKIHTVEVKTLRDMFEIINKLNSIDLNRFLQLDQTLDILVNNCHGQLSYPKKKNIRGRETINFDQNELTFTEDDIIKAVDSMLSFIQSDKAISLTMAPMLKHLKALPKKNNTKTLLEDLSIFLSSLSSCKYKIVFININYNQDSVNAYTKIFVFSIIEKIFIFLLKSEPYQKYVMEHAIGLGSKYIKLPSEYELSANLSLLDAVMEYVNSKGLTSLNESHAHDVVDKFTQDLKKSQKIISLLRSDPEKLEETDSQNKNTPNNIISELETYPETEVYDSIEANTKNKAIDFNDFSAVELALLAFYDKRNVNRAESVLNNIKKIYRLKTIPKKFPAEYEKINTFANERFGKTGSIVKDRNRLKRYDKIIPGISNEGGKKLAIKEASHLIEGHYLDTNNLFEPKNFEPDLTGLNPNLP